jgi:hypothetical protein
MHIVRFLYGLTAQFEGTGPVNNTEISTLAAGMLVCGHQVY